MLAVLELSANLRCVGEMSELSEGTELNTALGLAVRYPCVTAMDWELARTNSKEDLHNNRTSVKQVRGMNMRKMKVLTTDTWTMGRDRGENLGCSNKCLKRQNI